MKFSDKRHTLLINLKKNENVEFFFRYTPAIKVDLISSKVYIVIWEYFANLCEEFGQEAIRGLQGGVDGSVLAVGLTARVTLCEEILDGLTPGLGVT